MNGAVIDIHLADTQLVGIGMRQYLFDFTDNNAVKTSCQFFGTFYLDSGHGKVKGQTFQVYIVRDFYIIFDPVE